VQHGAAILGTVILFGGMAFILGTRGLPVFQTSAEALRPTNSEAMDTFQWVQERLGRDHEASIPILITGPVEQVRARAEALGRKLDVAIQKGTLVRQALPTMMVTDPEAQKANREILSWLIQEVPRLEKAADAAGFTESATALLRGVTGVWKTALTKIWPHKDYPLIDVGVTADAHTTVVVPPPATSTSLVTYVTATAVTVVGSSTVSVTAANAPVSATDGVFVV
jgi:hypothetical protein